MKLFAVVHEEFGSKDFVPFICGNGDCKDGSAGDGLYLDEKKDFFKKVLGDRWSSLTALANPTFWSNVKRAKAGGYEGNMKGEGRLMGGLLVVGPGDKGITYSYMEKVFGDHAPHEEVLAAVKAVNAEAEGATTASL